MWTTFAPQQVDIDVRSAAAQAYLASVLDALAAARVSMVRLDAVGYAVKTPGTSSFMTPQTFAFIDDLTAQARSRGMAVLVEVHSHYERQVEIGRLVDRVYDFALPPLVLHALTTGDCEPLSAWMAVRPANAITVLDTHDGIGVIDVAADPDDPSKAGLLDPRPGGAAGRGHPRAYRGPEPGGHGVCRREPRRLPGQLHVLRALGRRRRPLPAARAIQFFTPGIPQVYYVGAARGRQRHGAAGRDRIGREINRHRYRGEEIDAGVRRPVVRALFRLVRFRNTHPAFDGELVAIGCQKRITLTWTAGEDIARLDANLATGEADVTWSAGGERVTASLADLP